MNLIPSRICECCTLPDKVAIKDSNTVVTNGCSLPLKRTPLHIGRSTREPNFDMNRAMFKFAWDILQPSNDLDSSLTSDSDSNTEQSENENHDTEADNSGYCYNL